MGEWRAAGTSYLKPNRTYCELCGQLIPGRYWAAEVEGAPRTFCSPEHEAKYHSYWLPRYGQGRRAATE
jgi:hypothetical protein